MTAREALITLNLIPGVGPVRVRALLEVFGTAELVLSAPKEMLCRVPRIGEKQARVIADWRHCVCPERELEDAERAGVRITTILDDEYPSALRDSQLYDPPPVLYSLGEWTEEDAKHGISVVGTRGATPYGLNCARSISRDLADRYGSCIFSGLARGIDTAAHRGALSAGGRTIAVLGSGMAHIFPQENEELARCIIGGHGAVVSEFPMNTLPSRTTFPQRNRIVAAWSNATLVVEAPHRSGALQTARLAAEYGKEVFAVPGQIGSDASRGSHALIRGGATLCTGAADIAADLEWGGGLRQKTLSLFDGVEPTYEEAESVQNREHILAAIEAGHCTLDALCSALGIGAGELTRELMKLQMKHLVVPLPGGRYAPANTPGRVAATKQPAARPSADGRGLMKRNGGQ